MAVDLKIELFSLDLFRNLWLKSGLLNFIPARVKMPRGGDDDQSSENSAEAVHAVWCRQQIFSMSLRKKVWVDHSSFSSSGVDFYLYIQHHALDFIPYHLNVFDRLLMTAAFVLEMSRCLSFGGRNFYLYTAPVSWAMFFDSEMKTEFYEEGGWEILKRYTTSYSASILAYQRIRSVCVRPDDYENARLLFESAGELYDLSTISQAFTARCEERKSELVTACSQCLPMSLVLRDSPRGPPEWGSVFVEGYLQIMLRMLTEEELVLRRDAFLDSLQCADSSDSEGSTTVRNSDQPPSEEGPDDAVIEEAFRSLTASELVDRLFADEDPCTQQCMFCGRIIGSLGFSECAKVSEHVERIQSAVGKVVDQETCEEPRWDRSASGLEDTIRLFLCLGLEPMRSQTLDSRPETKELIDDTCEAQLLRSPKPRRRRRSSKK